MNCLSRTSILICKRLRHFRSICTMITFHFQFWLHWLCWCWFQPCCSDSLDLRHSWRRRNGSHWLWPRRQLSITTQEFSGSDTVIFSIYRISIILLPMCVAAEKDQICVSMFFGTLLLLLCVFTFGCYLTYLEQDPLCICACLSVFCTSAISCFCASVLIFCNPRSETHHKLAQPYVCCALCISMSEEPLPIRCFWHHRVILMFA